MTDGDDDVPDLVVRHLVRHLGPDTARGKVTFVGAPPVQVLRFAGATGRTVRYVTVGMSRDPMHDPGDMAPDPVRGPRAELALTLRDPADQVLRPLTVLAAMPVVEGVVVGPGATYDLGAPLVPGSGCTGVLVDDPVADLPDLDPGGGRDPVRFLPLVPATPEELAYKRVHGAAALWEQWHREQTDLTDLGRRGVRLELPRRDA